MAFLLNRFLSPDNRGALANANFDEDFGPTRDKMIDDSGQFTYKHSNGESRATETSRGALMNYYPSIFGEVIEMNEKEAGWEITLACPGTLDESGEDAYQRQLEILRSIIQRESDEDGGEVVRTWIGKPDGAQCDKNVFNVFLSCNKTDWVIGINIVVGTLLGMWVHLHRFDRVSGGRNLKSYRLDVDFFTPLGAAIIVP